jgi:hypothetical protein
MKIKEHGNWVLYRPSAARLKELQEQHWPPNALFCKREGSGTVVDWYDYQKQFAGGDAVMATVYEEDGVHTIGTANHDAGRLYPNGAMVIEIEGYTGKNLEDLYNRVYDPKSKTIKDRLPRPTGPDPRQMAKEIEDLKEMVAALLKQKK